MISLRSSDCKTDAGVAGALIIPSLVNASRHRIRRALERVMPYSFRELAIVLPAREIPSALGLVPYARRGAVRFICIGTAPTSRSAAINLCAVATTATRIAIVDDDFVVTAATIRRLWKRCTRATFSTPRIVRAHGARPSLDPPEILSLSHVIRFRRGLATPVRVETGRLDFEQRGRAAPEIICVWRQAFFRLQGMNSALRSPEWESIDLLIRLQLAVGLRRVQIGSALWTPVKAIPRGATSGDVTKHALALDSALRGYWLSRFGGSLKSDVRAAGGAELTLWRAGLGWRRVSLRKVANERMGSNRE